MQLLAPIILAAVAWLHVFAAIGWMGAVLTFGMVVSPGVRKLSPSARLEFVAKILPKFARFGVIFAGLTLLFGVFLAYFLFDALFNPLIAEGTYIGIGAALALIAFLIALLMVEPTVKKVSKLAEGALKNPGPPPPELGSMMSRLRVAARVVLGLLVLTLIFMIGAAWT